MKRTNRGDKNRYKGTIWRASPECLFLNWVGKERRPSFVVDQPRHSQPGLFIAWSLYVTRAPPQQADTWAMLPRQCSVSPTHTRNSEVVSAKIGLIYLNKAKLLPNGLMGKELLRICVSFNQMKEGIFSLNIRERIRMMGIRLAVITVRLADKDLRLNIRFWVGIWCSKW